MSNQPRARPLFRIGSFAPPAPASTRAPAPAPQTQTDPTPSPPPPRVRPAFRPLFTHTFGRFATQPAHEAPPGPQAPNTTTPSAPTTAAQPPPQPVATTQSMPLIAADAPPVHPRAAVSAPPPPPPDAVPPPPSTVSSTPHRSNSESRFPREDDKKTVLLKEKIEKARPILEADRVELIMKSHDGKQMTKEDGHNMYSSYNEEISNSMRVIHIAGENQGALMKLGYSAKKQVGGHAIGTATEPTRDKGRSRVMKNEVLGNGSLPRQPMYVNSNVQGVNSSILHNSSCSYNDPGVHCSYSTMSSNGRGIYHTNEGLNKPIQKRGGNLKEKILGSKE